MKTQPFKDVNGEDILMLTIKLPDDLAHKRELRLPRTWVRTNEEIEKIWPEGDDADGGGGGGGAAAANSQPRTTRSRKDEDIDDRTARRKRQVLAAQERAAKKQTPASAKEPAPPKEGAAPVAAEAADGGAAEALEAAPAHGPCEVLCNEVWVPRTTPPWRPGGSPVQRAFPSQSARKVIVPDSDAKPAAEAEAGDVTVAAATDPNAVTPGVTTVPIAVAAGGGRLPKAAESKPGEVKSPIVVDDLQGGVDSGGDGVEEATRATTSPGEVGPGATGEAMPSRLSMHSSEADPAGSAERSPPAENAHATPASATAGAAPATAEEEPIVVPGPGALNLRLRAASTLGDHLIAGAYLPAMSASKHAAYFASVNVRAHNRARKPDDAMRPRKNPDAADGGGERDTGELRDEDARVPDAQKGKGPQTGGIRPREVRVERSMKHPKV